MHHMYSNSHASATPQIHMPMNNMMSSVNQVETPHVGTSNSMQQSVSTFYSSANNSQYVNPNMPMDREIGHATTSYLANYPQPSYVAPYVTNFSAPYAASDMNTSAPHFYNGYSRLSGNSEGANVLSSSAAAYGTSPVQL